MGYLAGITLPEGSQRHHSDIIPIESNVLINPLHPNLTTARHIRTDDFRFDSRLALEQGSSSRSECHERRASTV
jgi:hypothetical protein